MKKLTDEEIHNMVSDIVSAVDYDIWKEMFPENRFIEDCDELTKEMNEETVYQLTSIVKSYLEE